MVYTYSRFSVLPPRWKGLLLIGCMALGACTKAQNTTSEALDTVGTETSSSYNKLRDYLDLGHKKKPVERTIASQPRYCYHTYQDIICYAQPLPGEEYRLVAFQNSKGGTGYTIPPVPAVDSTAIAASPVQPLPAVKPVKTAPAQSLPTASNPVQPDKAGQPVPAGGGALKKDDKQLKEIIFDPSELQPKELVPEKMQ